MRLGAAPNSPWANLTQRINNLGICRIAFTVDDIDRTFAGSADKEDRMCGAAPEGQASDGAPIGAVCFRDPDGAILELISGV